MAVSRHIYNLSGTNLGKIFFLHLSSIKTSTRHIMLLDELSNLVHLQRLSKLIVHPDALCVLSLSLH